MLIARDSADDEHWAEMLKGAQAPLAAARTMFDN